MDWFYYLVKSDTNEIIAVEDNFVDAYQKANELECGTLILQGAVITTLDKEQPALEVPAED